MALVCLVHALDVVLFERGCSGAKTREWWGDRGLGMCDSGLRSLNKNQTKHQELGNILQRPMQERVSVFRMLQVELAAAAGEGQLCGTPGWLYSK